ncbi:hypothetical protein LEP1GSC050_0702 [Leptospira broomii serovar Hurstbridge str. 5399]|uniref:Uncharacterized protein n=1 Tax=Leptospira broomii serovar Hurstbridge str. 5399 TaxID=1049789 RepID=T0GPC3_9LEPT|nr:hypothetical protein LEP1GSC050_0702 [Leptospira broomii serovar Hurstbridge str. 5399]
MNISYVILIPHKVDVWDREYTSITCEFNGYSAPIKEKYFAVRIREFLPIEPF